MARLRRFFGVFVLLCLFSELGAFGAGAFVSGAEAAGVKIEPTPQLPQVIIRENFIQQATKCIQEARAAEGDTRRCTIEGVYVPAGLRLPWGQITYSCVLPNGIRKGGQLTAVTVNVLLDGRQYAAMNCSMRVRVFENVVVSARRILKETPLQAEDLKLAEKEDKGSAFDTYADVGELVGKVVSGNLAADTLIHSGMVREPILIRAYSTVNICTDVNGVTVNTVGTAMEMGRRGAVIVVRNDTSKRRVRARVIDESTVQVI